MSVLNGFLDLSRADAGGANPHGLGFAVNHDFDFLQVRFPAPVGQFMGMADIMSIDRFLAAYIAYFRHFTVLLCELDFNFTLFCR
jgi:hypothetical protein